MANMSYCRFENTLGDFRDCLRALREEGIQGIDSQSERECAESLFFAAQKFVTAYQQSLAIEGEAEFLDKCKVQPRRGKITTTNELPPRSSPQRNPNAS